MSISLSNINPRLDKDIPKAYTYIVASNANYFEEQIESYKGKKDKESKDRPKQLKEALASHIVNMKNFDSGEVINLYFNSETIRDFSKDESIVNFHKQIVYRIKPIAMKEAWKTSGSRKTYDLNSFKVIEKITDQETLLQRLNEDNLLTDYILSYFLQHCYANEGHKEKREVFMDYVKVNFPDKLPSLYNVYERYYSYSNGYQNSDKYKMQYVYDEYKNGGFTLLDKDGWYLENIIEFILKERMFDLIEDVLNLKPSTVGALKLYSTKYKDYKAVKEIYKLCMNNSDNPYVKKLIEFAGFAPTGFTLRIYKYNEDDRDEYIDKRESFETIEAVKRWLLKTFDNIDINEVSKGNIHNMEFREDDEWIKLTLETKGIDD